MKYYLKAFRQYADFSGRARRKEYWMFALFNFIFYFILYIILLISIMMQHIIFASIFGILFIIYCIAIIIPSLSISVRRLHDIGKSGWNLLLGFIPFIGGIILLIYFVKKGDLGENQFGKDPKLSIQTKYEAFDF